MLKSPDVKNIVLLKSSHFRLWFVIAVASFLLLIVLPDFFYWALISHFQEPLPIGLGSYNHYLTWIRDIFQGRFSDNPYFLEHSGGVERFLLFQLTMRLIPYATQIPMGWWYVILKGVSALALFIELHLLLKNFGLERRKSLGLTTFFFFFYGPFALLGPGPDSWFLVFFLAGILLLFRLPQFQKLWQQVVCIGIANILFAVHPVYFSLGVLIGGLWFLWFSVFDRGKHRWALLGSWVLFSLLNAKVFYSAHISSLGQVGFMHETLARMGVDFNRLPNLPLESLRLAFAFIALAALAYAVFKKSSGESRLFQALLFLSISFASVFFAINSNIVTGFSVVPDHYLLPENFFAVILLGFVFFVPLPEMAHSRFRWFAAVFSIILGLTVISLFYGRPWRSWLVVGGKIPLIAGYALLIWRLWSVSVPAFILKKLAFISVASAVAFGLVFSWRLHAHNFSSLKSDELNRPVITALRSLEPGVVLARPELSNVIVLYTNHKAYWTDDALGFSGSNAEFKKRWLDAARFYPESVELVGPDCNGIAGMSEGRIVILSDFEQAIARAFFASLYNRLFISTSKLDAACVELRQESKKMPLTSTWRPAYQLDYVIFEKGKDSVPPALARYFEFLENAGEFSIYKFK